MNSGKHLEQKCLGVLQTKWNCWNWEGFLFYLWWRISFMASSAVDSSLETSARWFLWRDLERSSGISKKRCEMFLWQPFLRRSSWSSRIQCGYAAGSTNVGTMLLVLLLDAVFTIKFCFYVMVGMMTGKNRLAIMMLKMEVMEWMMTMVREDLMDTQEPASHGSRFRKQ